MSAVAKTLWLLESRFGETLSLDEMAEHAGVSRSHLSRIFPIATGYSISAYVRGRRLTEAAKALADGAPDILGVALDVGYGSHEAFTRAFRDQFDLTPDELRRTRSLSNLQLVEPLRMDTPEKVKLDPPKIVELPTMRIAGLAERHLMTKPATIPPQWQKFHHYIGNVTGSVPGHAYGVVGPMDRTSEEFDYLCGVEIRGNAELPPEFAVWTVPGGKFAKAAHRGHITTIRSTIGALMEEWLPNSGYTARYDAISFIEYYGPDFNAVSGLGTVEIWVGLK
ncbi:MAG: AraC family transcriptional regulator [Devosia sp.]